MTRATALNKVGEKTVAVPPLRDTAPCGDHSLRTWTVAAEVRNGLERRGVKLPKPRS